MKTPPEYTRSAPHQSDFSYEVSAILWMIHMDQMEAVWQSLYGLYELHGPIRPVWQLMLYAYTLQGRHQDVESLAKWLVENGFADSSDISFLRHV